MRRSALAILAIASLCVPAEAGGWGTVHRYVKKSGLCGDAKEVLASYYWVGAKTSTGERFNPHALTAASHDYPLGTVITAKNPRTGKTCSVRINDRGPYGAALKAGTRIDFAVGAARCLGMTGTAYVCAALPTSGTATEVADAEAPK